MPRSLSRIPRRLSPKDAHLLGDDCGPTLSGLHATATYLADASELSYSRTTAVLVDISGASTRNTPRRSATSRPFRRGRTPSVLLADQRCSLMHLELLRGLLSDGRFSIRVRQARAGLRRQRHPASTSRWEDERRNHSHRRVTSRAAPTQHRRPLARESPSGGLNCFSVALIGAPYMPTN